MDNSQMNNTEFHTLVDNIQAFMDSMVNEGSDQDLFIAGYLSGHFSLALSQCELSGDLRKQTLDDATRASLTKAIADGELEAEDQKDAWAFWERCINR